SSGAGAGAGTRLSATLASVRVPRARLVVAAAALLVAAGILFLTRGFSFYFDEWSFILTAPDWTALTILQPHNEHPAMLARLVYLALLSTVGLRSYLPYMAVLMALHATSAVLLFELIRRRQGDLVGLASALLLLVIGAGWEDLLWAFQIGFVGSVACGLGMMLALEGPRSPRRLAIAAGLLTASLMFSGIGLVFGVTAGVRLIAAPDRRRDLAWLVPIAVAFAAWYLAFGRSGPPSVPPASLHNLVLLPLYMAWGLAGSCAGLIGVAGAPAFVVLAFALAAIAMDWRLGKPDALALGAAAGLLAFFLVTGLTRAQLGVEQSASGRYVYIGAAFWIVLLAGPAARLPWRGTWRPALAACLFLACFNSAVLLFAYSAAKTAQMEREAADLAALSDERSDPCLNPDGAVDPLVMPQVTSPAAFYRATDLYGFPAPSVPVDQAALAAARANLRKPGC
ncbi:MAG TPA: hypothetical protein VEW68_01895, partial [Patescibacteria group bacterium]|nr:hypothetical protein [Patescibacteria group bacterium]